MASHPVATGKIGTGLQTTVANTADQCPFADNFDYVEVISDGAFDLWVTVSGVDPATPFDLAWRLPAGQRSARYIPTFGSSPDVRLKAPGIVIYSITGINV